MNDRLKEIRERHKRELKMIAELGFTISQKAPAYADRGELLQMLDDLFLTPDDDDRVAAWQKMYHNTRVESDRRIKELQTQVKHYKDTIKNWRDSYAPDPLPDGVKQFVEDLEEQKP